jgi:molecular chaperone GrpE
MKHKKSTGQEEKNIYNAEGADNLAENNGNGNEKVEAPSTSAEKEVQETPEQKILELNDKLLRLYSEFDNYRKRTIKEKIEMSKAASEELITDLLPVLDDFERAFKSFETTDNLEALKEGVQLIFSKFKNILISKGLQEIPALGEPFNTDHQEAIAHIPAPSEDLKNKVVDELQKGYKLNDKVIRFAKVVIGS